MDEVTIEKLAEVLQEPHRAMLAKVLRVLGPARTTAFLIETLHAEAAGGVLTKDGTRRRTAGGTFFHRVRQQVSRAERWELFRRRAARKSPNVQGEPAPFAAPKDAGPKQRRRDPARTKGAKPAGL